jgi:RNA-binding protein Musashi
MELDHTIDGKLIDPKPAVPKGSGGQQQANGPPSSSYQSNNGPPRQQGGGEKIFVGGLHQTVTESSFADYFSQFGGVRETLLMMDRETGRPRGYFSYITPLDLDLLRLKTARLWIVSWRVKDPSTSVIN